MGEAESRGFGNVRVLSLSTHVIKSQRTRWSCLDHVPYPGSLIMTKGEDISVGRTWSMPGPHTHPYKEGSGINLTQTK